MVRSRFVVMLRILQKIYGDSVFVFSFGFGGYSGARNILCAMRKSVTLWHCKKM